MGNWAEESTIDIRAKYQQDVFIDTWGHLAPKKNTSYKIVILFMVSEYGGNGATLIDTRLNDGLEDSPWLYDAINNYIWENRP
jgi:hypothetical protein